MDIIKRKVGGTTGRQERPKTKPISTRVTEDIYKELKAEAERNNCNVSTLLFSILTHRYLLTERCLKHREAMRPFQVDVIGE